MEAAENIVENETEAMQELTKVHTPEMHTIEQVVNFYMWCKEIHESRCYRKFR